MRAAGVRESWWITVWFRTYWELANPDVRGVPLQGIVIFFESAWYGFVFGGFWGIYRIRNTKCEKETDSMKHDRERRWTRWFSGEIQARESLKEIPFWTAALITGFVAVGFAELLSFSEKFSKNLISNHPYRMLLFTPLCFLLGWWLVSRFAPEARGSGIPQVMASVEAIESKASTEYLESRLSLRVILVKILSSAICVLGGGAVGREGPTIQIAASIFHFIGTRSRRLSGHINPEVWLVAGGSAGIAAAFNTPLGGLVYGIEELATSHFNRFKTSLITAVIVSGLASQWVSGTYLYLGYPKISTVTIQLVPWAIFVGVICGGWGAFFGKVLFWIAERRGRLTELKQYAVFALLCGFAFILTAVFVDSRIVGPGRETILHLLFENAEATDLKLVLARFFGPMISYLSGCAGGIFAPSLAAGGVLGAFIAKSVHTGNENLFVLLGMIAFLTGVTRAPFTSFVLVLEMTDRHSAIFPMMLAAISASLVGRMVDQKSFYEHIKEGYSLLMVREGVKNQSSSD